MHGISYNRHTMSEIPKFLHGIDPDMVLEIDKLMEGEVEKHAEHQLEHIETIRQLYIAGLAEKMNAIELCIANPSFCNIDELNKANGTVTADFSYYVDQIFAAPFSINKAAYLSEALSMADDAQSELNKKQVKSWYVYDSPELRTLIGEALAQDDEVKAKQGILAIYRNVREVVVRFIRENSSDL